MTCGDWRTQPPRTHVPGNCVSRSTHGSQGNWKAESHPQPGCLQSILVPPPRITMRMTCCPKQGHQREVPSRRPALAGSELGRPTKGNALVRRSHHHQPWGSAGRPPLGRALHFLLTVALVPLKVRGQVVLGGTCWTSLVSVASLLVL